MEVDNKTEISHLTYDRMTHPGRFRREARAKVE